MKRIGGPSAVPHSRTCRRSPPPPRTSWILALLAAACATSLMIASCRRRVDGSVPGRERERIGQRALSAAARRRIFGRQTAYLRPGTARYSPLMVARAGAELVGRARELEDLERALEATRAGAGSTALIAGDAGIGKTRLAAELASRAGDAGFDVFVGRS